MGITSLSLTHCPICEKKLFFRTVRDNPHHFNENGNYVQLFCSTCQITTYGKTEAEALDDFKKKG
jgi:hypothetical protein